MELRNPMKGIGFGWSLTCYARCRVVRTPLSCFVPAHRAVGNQDSTVSFENGFNGIMNGFRMHFKKKISMVSHGCDFKIVAQPGCCLFSSLLLSRSGQAGLRVVTVMVSEHGQDLVAPN